MKNKPVAAGAAEPASKPGAPADAVGAAVGVTDGVTDLDVAELAASGAVVAPQFVPVASVAPVAQEQRLDAQGMPVDEHHGRGGSFEVVDGVRRKLD